MTPEELVSYITQPAVADQLWQALVKPHLGTVYSIFYYSVGLIIGLSVGLVFERRVLGD